MNKKALFYDDLESEEGCVVREKIDRNTALMKDGQKFDYAHSVNIEDMACPICGSNNDLVFKGDAPEFVLPGYVGACIGSCHQSFLLSDLIKKGKAA